MLAALGSVLTLFLVIGAGWLLARRGFFTAEHGALFARIVIGFSLPPLLLHHLVTGFTRADLAVSGPGFLVALGAMLVSAALAPWAARLGGVPPARRGTFAALFTASNAIFMGMPVNLAFFGPGCVPAVLLYYAANTVYFWTLGAHGIETDGGQKAPILSREHLRRLLSPPFLAFLLGFALVALAVPLPRFLLEAMKLVGALTTPLSLLFIGITFAGLAWHELRPGRDMGLLLAGRFLLAPLVILALARLAHLPPLVVKVFVIQAAMPAITQSALVARAAGADHRFASVMVSATNLASLAVLPLYLALLNTLYPSVGR